MRTSRKTDFRKLKITLVTMTYHSQRPQCPSLAPHVLLFQRQWSECHLLEKTLCGESKRKTVPYHIISCNIIPYHIISYHIISIISYHIMSYHTISHHHIISYHVISYHIISYHTIPYHTIPYHIISYLSCHIYHVIPYHIIPCHIISYHNQNHISIIVITISIITKTI